MNKKFFIVPCMIIVGIGSYLSYPSISYSLGEKQLSKGKYVSAKKRFVSLEDYKESETYVKECDYQLALMYMEAGRYEESNEIFLALEGYKDVTELVKEIKYLVAQMNIEAKKYDLALKELKRIEGYKDVNEIIKETTYLVAQMNIEAKEYDLALESLRKIVDYKDVNEIIEETTYNKAIELVEKKEYNDAIKYFSEIIDYKDSATQSKEAQYQKGVEYYEKGNFSSACNVFTNLSGYKDSNELFGKSKHMTRYIGSWKTKYNFSEVVISGWKITNIYNISGKNSSQHTFEFKLLDDGSIDTNYDVYRISSDSNTLTRYDRDYSSGKLSVDGKLYTKSSGSTYVPEERAKPYIGMTKVQLEESSWGKPKDINRTTTAYGVREQWCYSGYKYVYVENGVVTAIQE